MFHVVREKSFWRHLLPILLPFALFVGIAVWTLHYFNQQSHVAALSRHVDHSINHAAILIRDELSRVTTDILFGEHG